MNPIPTATILVSFTHQDEQARAAFDNLADKLAARLAQPVAACALDQPERTMLHAITGLLQQGIVKVVILPLFLSPAEYRDNTLADAVAFASGRWPHAHFHLSPTPTWSEWLRMVGGLAIEAMDGQPNSRSETAVILAGHGSSDPDVNSDLVKLARLLYEDYAFGWADVAFITETTPSVSDLIARYQTFGAKQIIIVAALLFAGRKYHDLRAHVDPSQFTIHN